MTEQRWCASRRVQVHPICRNRPPADWAGLTIRIMLSNVPARFAESAAGMTIDRENVLKVGAVLVAEVGRLQGTLRDNDWVRMGRCGGDPVSEDAEAAFNERAALLFAAFQREVDDLKNLAHAVREAARAYGVAEADVAAVFGK